MKLKFIEFIYEKYNRIPIIYEDYINLDNSFNIYLKYYKYKKKNTFLLESITSNKIKSRYSFIGLSSNIEILNFKKKIKIINNKNVKLFKDNIFNFIPKFQLNYKVFIIPKLLCFCGGLVGYFGYDCIKYIEKKININKKKNIFKVPDFLLLMVENFIIIDNLLGKLIFINYINPKLFYNFLLIKKYIKKIIYILNKFINISNKIIYNNKKIIHLFNKKRYIKSVLKAKKYILSGDIMQIQISQCFKQKFLKKSLLLYRILKLLNPSPYLYFYNFKNLKIIGSSPEILIRNKFLINKKNNNLLNKVIIKPIAGTKSRNKHLKKDFKIEKELLLDKKEISEHIMLIDLARNDISKFSKTGTLKIIKKMFIEKYSHVQHIVSKIECIVKKNINNIYILKSVFPAGTLSGASKIRAMQIINKLEPINRNIYGGGSGFLSFNNIMNISIIIRTAIIINKFLYIQSAAGIVHDSIPIMEFIETKNKAYIFLKAIKKFKKIIKNYV